MPALDKALSVIVAAVVLLQPAVACCGMQMAANDTTAVAQEWAQERVHERPATAGHDHCGDLPAVPSIDEKPRCDCGDGCASLEALSPQAPEAALLSYTNNAEPVALFYSSPAMLPALRAVFAQGLPPPAAAPRPRSTLVSLKRLLLI